MTGKTGRWADSTLLACACIALLGLLVYGHTLHVPWHFDDLRGIVENPAIRDFDAATQQLLAPGRGLALWTFALNYRLGGLNVTGYHLVNIAIHLATTGLVLLLLRRLFTAPSWLPLLGAALFLVHPVQTGGVTYIIQRMTSLSGLCFLLSLHLYLRGRETLAAAGFGATRHLLCYTGALLSGAAAVLIKQNAAILPLALLLWEMYFPGEPPRSRKERLLYLLPFLIVPFGLAAQQLFLPLLHGAEFRELTSVSATGAQSPVNLRALTPLNYLITEFSVLWLYIRLLFLPYGQVLDYNYPVATTLLTLPGLLALLGLGGLFALALVWQKRLPLISFGILWFFLCLSVESTLIPLDPAFEHRLYVPLFGFVLVVLDSLRRLIPQPRRQVLVLLVIIAVWGGVAWERNRLWNDPIAFYESNLQRRPGNERVGIYLSRLYMEAGRYAAALPLLEEIIRLNPGYVDAYVNLSQILIDQGAYDQALAVLQRGLQQDGNNRMLNENLAALYERTGRIQEAIRILNRVVAIDPAYALAYFSLGMIHADRGEIREALALLARLQQLDRALAEELRRRIATRR